MKRLRLHATGQSKFSGLWPTLLASIAFALVAIPTFAFASGATEGEGGDAALAALPGNALREAQAAQSSPASELTDLQAARELPHSDLNRDEALDLLEGVFEPVLQAPAGDFDSLDVKKFLSADAAIVYPPAEAGVSQSIPGQTDGEHEATPALLESTLPLRVPSSDGSSETVDLSLEHVGDQIESVASIEPVAIPESLGEGVELPESGIRVELVGAPEDRAPSIIEESVAAYPNTAADTDFAVAPTPTGVETLTTLRSADAPLEQTFRLRLPSGASLVERDHGGAEVRLDNETILRVPSPTAIDATGAPVPTSMRISGDTITVTTSPQVGTAYPILVDPMYEGFAWKNGATPGMAGWTSYTNTPLMQAAWTAPSPFYGPSPYLLANVGYYPLGAQTIWYHTVPRYSEFYSQGKYPRSFISHLSGSAFTFLVGQGGSPGRAFLFAGIFNPSTQKWVTESTGGKEAVLSWAGNSASFENGGYNFTSGTAGKFDEGAQIAYGMSLAVSEPGELAGPRISYLGYSNVEIEDHENPTIVKTTEPTSWVNNSPGGPITAEAKDEGLGIKSITFGSPGAEVTTTNPCGGQTQDPCPTKSTASLGVSQYAPWAMPQGLNWIPVTARDVLGNANTSGKVLVKVDHTAPTVALSGTLTEQASLGTYLPQYKLKYVASDGTEASPQSGVVSTELRIDEKAVEPKVAPGCPEENCAITKEWTLNASQYTSGTHTVEVIATDAVGLKVVKPLTIKLSEDTTPPQINSTGALYSAPAGWVEQKSYAITANATDAKAGTTSLLLKIDGATVKSATGNCAAGGCTKSLSGSLNMATYKGGDHSAQLIATDAAGRVSTKAWTINVDPSGSVPAAEATDTIEALEATEPEAEVVTPTDESLTPGERAVGNDPALESKEGGVVSTGVPVETTIDPLTEKITVESTEGDITVAPVASTGSGVKEIASEIAAVSPNTKAGVDTMIRAEYDGALAFQAIRQATAPENYSWEVTLKPGQTLNAIEGGLTAGVFYKDGTEVMLINAMPAHDAVGHAVPTHLSVSGGNIVTLTVEHQKSVYTYPVLAGPSFQVGYVTAEFIPPPPKESEEEKVVTPPIKVAAPIPVPANSGAGEDEAVTSKAPQKFEVRFEVPGEGCAPTACVPRYWSMWIKDHFIENGHVAWWRPKDEKAEPMRCLPWTYVNVSISKETCGWIGKNYQTYGGGYHITAQTLFTVTKNFDLVETTKYKAISVYMYGNGHVTPAQYTDCVCNPFLSQDEQH
jgi:hypothetical protein